MSIFIDNNRIVSDKHQAPASTKSYLMDYRPRCSESHKAFSLTGQINLVAVLNISVRFDNNVRVGLEEADDFFKRRHRLALIDTALSLDNHFQQQ